MNLNKKLNIKAYMILFTITYLVSYVTRIQNRSGDIPAYHGEYPFTSHSVTQGHEVSGEGVMVSYRK